MNTAKYTYKITTGNGRPFPYSTKFYINGVFDELKVSGTLWGARREVKRYRKALLTTEPPEQYVMSGDVFS